MYPYIIICCFEVKTVQAIADQNGGADAAGRPLGPKLRAESILVHNGGESVFARAKIRCFPIVAIEPPNRMPAGCG
jgi:hypothetical protein